MGGFSRWLLHDDQKEFFDYLFAVVLNAVFVALAALVLWPLGRAAMALELAKGYWVFWIFLTLAAALLVFVQRLFRVDIDSHFDAYVISSLAVSALIQLAWSAFAALTVDGFAAAASGWVTAILHVTGVLSCWVAYVAVSAFYMGGLYRLVNLALAVLGYGVFSVWTAAGRAIHGWFLAIFGLFA